MTLRPSHRPIHVLALVAYPVDTTPGQRFRIEQWAPYLAQEGIEVRFAPFADQALVDRLYSPGGTLPKALALGRALVRRLRQALDARNYDCVFVPREASLIGPALAERVARWRNPAFVFDFDDAVWVPYVSPTNRFFSYLKMPWKTRALCRMAAVVMAGNDYLASYARRFNPRVSIVPTTVSLRQYKPVSRRVENPIPVVGWTGSHSSAQYLKLITPALTELRRRHEFKVVIVGAEGLSVPGVETECRPWRAATEIADISDLDVGLMPLPDEAWARGKCALKAIQYMGIGIPAVVSPVGVNAEVVSHGETGFHATSESEWIDAIGRLLSDAPLRRQLGAAAYERVRALYSAESQAPRVAALLREAVGLGQGQPTFSGAS